MRELTACGTAVILTCLALGACSSTPTALSKLNQHSRGSGSASTSASTTTSGATTTTAAPTTTMAGAGTRIDQGSGAAAGTNTGTGVGTTWPGFPPVITSTNERAPWSGYATVNTPVTGIRARWQIPSSCLESGNGPNGTAYWVGLDGLAQPVIEQIGTSFSCSASAQPRASLWYQLYPQPPVGLSGAHAGDVISASVVADSYTPFSSTGFRLDISDLTTGSSWTEHGSQVSAPLANAEVVAENPVQLTPPAPAGWTDFFDCAVRTADSSWRALGEMPSLLEMTNIQSGYRLFPSSLTTPSSFATYTGR